MKKQILIIIALCTGITVFGQESEELVKEKTKRFSIGIQAVLLNSSYGGNNLQEYGGGIYMRYFLGKRLAINMQANTTIGTRNGFGIADYKRRSFEVPVMLEYHLYPGSNVRTYFGLGGGVTSQHTAIKFQDGKSTYHHYSQTPFLQMSYGMGFQMGKKMSLNTSLFYRYNISSKQSQIGISLGLQRRR